MKLEMMSNNSMQENETVYTIVLAFYKKAHETLCHTKLYSFILSNISYSYIYKGDFHLVENE